MELQELALRIRRGDRDALKTLISEYGVGVYQKAYQKTQDKVLAREATRQTFAQLVTSLQEQTDMDGWELWLNALAKRNIDTYCNIGADMAFLERQLNTELFMPASAGAPQAAPPMPDAAQQFAMQQKLEAQRRYDAEQARLRVERQYAAEQARALAKQQYDAEQARIHAREQYEAEQARFLAQQQYESEQALLRAQYGAAPVAQAPSQPAPQQPAPQQPAPQQSQDGAPQQPAQASVAPPPTAPEWPERVPAAQEKGGRRKRKKSGVSLTPEEANRSSWPVVVLLVLLCIALVWLVVGVIMSLGWLPKLDWGYEWFNTHVLDLF